MGRAGGKCMTLQFGCGPLFRRRMGGRGSELVSGYWYIINCLYSGGGRYGNHVSFMDDCYSNGTGISKGGSDTTIQRTISYAKTLSSQDTSTNTFDQLKRPN